MSRVISPAALMAAKSIIATAEAQGVCSGSDVKRGNLAASAISPYYSCGELVAAGSGATPDVYTCARGAKLRLFGYGIGESMATAGIDDPDRADETHTNLTNAAQTNAGESVRIVGCMLQILAVGVVSDPKFAAAALHNITAAFELTSGKGRWLVGPADSIPGGPGLYGAAFSKADDSNFAAMTSSMPGPGAFFRMPEGIPWTDKGENSRLVLVLDNPSDIVFEGSHAPYTPDEVRLRLRATFVTVPLV